MGANSFIFKFKDIGEVPLGFGKIACLNELFKDGKRVKGYGIMKYGRKSNICIFRGLDISQDVCEAFELLGEKGISLFYFDEVKYKRKVGKRKIEICTEDEGYKFLIKCASELLKREIPEDWEDIMREITVECLGKIKS